MVIYDPPGFFSTTGIHQEILDSYCNAKMFKVGSQAKIIIVIEQSSLMSTKGRAVVDVAVQLFKLFENEYDRVINSCMLVVTKLDMKKNDMQKKVEETINDISGFK